jgi:phage shock protein A
MKRKELKNLAQKIAAAEILLQTSDDAFAKQKAQDDILELSGHARTVEDMLALDEMIQKILEEKS